MCTALIVERITWLYNNNNKEEETEVQSHTLKVAEVGFEPVVRTWFKSWGCHCGLSQSLTRSGQDLVWLFHPGLWAQRERKTWDEAQVRQLD